MNRFRKFMIVLCSVLFVFAASLAFASCGENADDGGQGGQEQGGQQGGEEQGGSTVPEKKKFTVTLDFDEANGTISLSPVREDNLYEEGEEVTAQVAPLPGRTLSSFTVNGTETALQDGSYRFKVAADTALKAVFSTVPMSTECFSSLTGQRTFEGTGGGMRAYDGYDDFEMIDKFSYKTVFDGDLARRFKRDDGFSLILEDNVFRNENGTAVLYRRTADNKIEKTETETGFETYRNPFGTVLAAEDLILTGTDVYSVTDPDKASLAAQALTGVKEAIAFFRVYVAEGAAHTVAFSTELEQRGEGVSLGYTYYIDYVFDVGEGEALSSCIAPYEAGEEHIALERALQSAENATSYTIDMDDAWNDGAERYSGTVYVTEKAYWYEDETDLFGFAAKDDGYVHELSLDEGKLIWGAVLQMDGTDENGDYGYHDVTDMAEILAHFALVAPAMFEAKGEGVFELRPQDAKLAPEIAQWLYDGNDGVTMLYAKGVRITVENEEIKSVEVSITMFSDTRTITFGYRDRNCTVLPYPIEGEEEVPATAIPEKFHGEFVSEDGRYTVTISADGVVITIDGANATVEELLYHADHDNFTLKLNGKQYTIENYSGGEQVDEIGLSADDWHDPSPSLTRKGTGDEGGGSDPESKQASFFGTFASADGKYVLTISESGITATVDGVEAVVSDVVFDASQYEPYSFKINGENYTLSANSEDDPLTELALWKGLSLIVLTRQA